MSRFFIRVGHEELERACQNPKFSATHYAVFLTIRRYHNKKVGYSWPGIPLLVEETHTSRSGVKRAIRDLKEWGFVKVVYRLGLGNQYHLADCQCADCHLPGCECGDCRPLRVVNGGF